MQVVKCHQQKGEVSLRLLIESAHQTIDVNFAYERGKYHTTMPLLFINRMQGPYREILSPRF